MRDFIAAVFQENNREREIEVGCDGMLHIL